MKQQYRLFVLLICLILTVLSGCSSDEKLPEPAMVWMYGKEDEATFSLGIQFYNYRSKPGENLRTITYRELSSEQLGTKLHAELMGGKGPDLMLTTHLDLFSDVNKVVNSGAFQSWDKLISDWDEDKYFSEAVKGTYSPNQKSYILPLSFDTMFIITTRSNMEKYGFTEDDFSNFNKTTDTLLRLWEQLDGDMSQYAHVYWPNFCQAIPELFDYHTGKTALMEEETQELLGKWKTIISNRQERLEHTPIHAGFGDVNTVFGGSRIVEFVSGYELMRMTFTPSELEELVLIPVYDTQQKMIGNITSYALLSNHCKNEAAVKGYLDRMVFIIGDNGCIGDGIHNSMNGIHLGKDSTADFMSVYIENEKYIQRIMTAIDGNPMNLVMHSPTLESYNTRITQYLMEGESADWEDLEIDINIYLSE